MNILEVRDMNISIELNGIITSVIGPESSGKTIFLKKLCNILPNRDVFIDDVSIREYDITFLKNNVIVVFNDNNFNCEYVAEELFYYLDKLGYRIDEITKKIDQISKYFRIESKLDSRIDTLTTDYRILIKILSFLIIKPKIIAIDNLFGYLSKDMVNSIIKFIKINGITLINVTTYSDDLLLGDNAIVMHGGKAIICASVKSVLEGNSILPYIGFKLPFLVDLSHNLMLYGLVDKVYYDKRKLVDKIWK